MSLTSYRAAPPRGGVGKWALGSSPRALFDPVVSLRSPGLSTVMSLTSYRAAPPRARGRWSVVSGQWSVVSGRWSVVGGQWSVVGGQWSVVSGQWSVVSGQWSEDCLVWDVGKAGPVGVA